MKGKTVRVRQRGGYFYYSFDVERTAEGKRRSVERGGFATWEEAYDAGVAAYTDWRNGNIGITSKRVRVQDFLERWLEMKRLSIRASSLAAYRCHVKSIVCAIGQAWLQELRPRDVDALMQRLLRDGMSYHSIAAVKSLLTHALDYAIYPGELIRENPARRIRVPKAAPREVVRRQVIRRDQMEELLLAYPFGHAYHIPVLLAYHTGMRTAEILGLEWEQVDLAGRCLSVIQQLRFLPRKGRYFSAPKTRSSARTILLDCRIVEILGRWKKAQARRRGRQQVRLYRDSGDALRQVGMGQEPQKGWAEVHLVCTRPEGRPICHGSYAAALRPFGINPHSFRHTHATVLLERQAAVKDIAERLGHSSAAVTQNIYAHNTRQMQQRTVRIFEEFLGIGKKDM